MSVLISEPPDSPRVFLTVCLGWCLVFNVSSVRPKFDLRLEERDLSNLLSMCFFWRKFTINELFTKKYKVFFFVRKRYRVYKKLVLNKFFKNK